jgi:FtsH-binding integral membrane protein
MFLELLHRLALMTSFFATFAWSVRSIMNCDAISLAGAALGISLALVHLMVTGHEHRFWIALLLWLLAGTGLACAVLQKKIELVDMGFFSPIALAVCWLCLIPLLLSRMSHSARHPEP